MTRAVARWMLSKAKAELRNHRKDHREAGRLWRIYTARNRENPIWYQADECWRWMARERKILRQLREVVRDLRRAAR